jgi:hypothetical protein
MLRIWPRFCKALYFWNSKHLGGHLRLTHTLDFWDPVLEELKSICEDLLSHGFVLAMTMHL